MKKKLLYWFVLLFLYWSNAQAQTYKLGLKEVIKIASEQSIQAKLNENILDNKYYQYNIYKSNLRPSLSLSGNFPQYSKQYAPVIQPDGTQKYLPRYYNTAALGLSLYQEIPFTGGSISLFSGLNRFDDFDKKTHQYNSVPVTILINQPLFAFNPWKWKKKIQPLEYEKAKKQFNEDMADIAVQTTQLFFEVLTAQRDLQRESLNLKNNRLIYTIEQKRIDLGTTSKEKLLQIRLQVLQSEKEIRRAQLELQTAQQNLKTFIGLNTASNIRLMIPTTLPDIKIDSAHALALAKQRRPEITEFVLQMLEARRDLDQAKKSRFQVDITVSYGLNNAATSFPGAYHDLKDQQVANIGFNIPLFDWGRRKYQVETPIANKKVVQFTIDKEKLAFKQEVRTALANFNLLRNSIPIVRETDSIALERYQLALQQYQIGKLSITDLNIALSEKDNASNDYLQILKKFWSAYYLLRKLTLFDFEKKKAMVNEKR